MKSYRKTHRNRKRIGGKVKEGVTGEDTRRAVTDETNAMEIEGMSTPSSMNSSEEIQGIPPSMMDLLNSYPANGTNGSTGGTKKRRKRKTKKSRRTRRTTGG